MHPTNTNGVQPSAISLSTDKQQPNLESAKAETHGDAEKNGFDALFNFHPVIQKNIRRLQFKTPTPIQTQAIPVALDRKDMIGLAQTGTGKTAAFVLPILQKIFSENQRKLSALILVPTRELAEQVREVIVELGTGGQNRSLTIYGGVGMGPQVQQLRRGVNIVVACPGRLLDHLQQRTISLKDIDTLVLDEADQMFDMGFMPNVREIIRHLPKDRQTMLFSATMPPDIRRLANEVLTDPVTLQVNFTAPIATVSHALYPVTQQRKTALLVSLLQGTKFNSALVFTRTKHRAKRVAEHLQGKGFKVTCLQGNLSQNKRRFALEGFRNGKYDVLVATDIAARGIDISTVSHVINYDMPETVDIYTHRIGRTGRASRSGEAFSFITSEDSHTVRQVERAIGARIPQQRLAEFDYTAKQELGEREPGRDRNREDFERPRRDNRRFGRGGRSEQGGRPHGRPQERRREDGRLEHRSADGERKEARSQGERREFNRPDGERREPRQSESRGEAKPQRRSFGGRSDGRPQGNRPQGRENGFRGGDRPQARFSRGQQGGERRPDANR